MRYTLFLGCTVPTRARNYEQSARLVARRLGIDFVDIKDFACCGYPVKSVNYEAALLMAAMNLSLAESERLDLCTLCSACTSVLTEANRELRDDVSLRKTVNAKLNRIGLSYRGEAKVRHFARILYEEVGVEKIKGAVKISLEPFKFAAHYGCHYLKPSALYDFFDNPENPKTLDELITATGAKYVYYEKRKQCCGGAILGVDENISLTMAEQKLEHVAAVGADAVALICPFCNMMYDKNQPDIETKFGKSFNLPVLFYPQILGLALGFDPKELGLDMNTVKATPIIERLH